jgi:FkbM family methyltransferase
MDPIFSARYFFPIASILFVFFLLVMNIKSSSTTRWSVRPGSSVQTGTSVTPSSDISAPVFESLEILPLISFNLLKRYWRLGYGAGRHLENAIRLLHEMYPQGIENDLWTFVDCGAADYSNWEKGDMSHFLLAARLWGPHGRIFGFEPGPEPYRATLLKAEAVASESGASVTLIEEAVSDTVAELDWFSTLPDIPGLDVSKSFNVHSVEVAGKKLGTVRGTSLDAFAEREGLDRINFLKVDVEGHELKAIKGCMRLLSLGRVDVLTFEYGDKWNQEIKDSVSTGAGPQDELTHVPQEPSLFSAISLLYDTGMDVFYIGDGFLVPVSGPWWTPTLQICLFTHLFPGIQGSCWMDLIAIRRNWQGRTEFVKKWVKYPL